MTVVNSGGAQANFVAPTVTGNGTGVTVNYLTGPLPVTANIPGGNSASFTWTFSTTGIGIITFSAHANGTDNNSLVVYGADSNTVNVTSVANTPLLTASLATMPSDVSTNQVFTVIMTVNNIGLVDSAAVTISALNLTGTGMATLISSVQPATQPIQAGHTGNFTWKYQATGAGSINFSGYALSSTGNVNSNTTSAYVTAHNAPILAQDIIVSPPVISVGQAFTIQFVVTNTGGAAAEGVSPGAFIKIGIGSYSYVSGPAPSTQTVGAGLTREFTYVYQATSAGDLGVNSHVKGYDEYSKVTITSVDVSSNTIMAEIPAALASSIYAPLTVNKGQYFTVTMSVTNSGQVGVLNAVPQTLSIDGPGGAILVPPVLPATATIAAGATQVFTFTYSAAGTGTLSFRGFVSGQDANSLAVINSPETSSNVMSINKPASLSMNLSMSTPAQIGTGEFISLILTVSNTGDTAAMNVTPAAMTRGGSGVVTLITNISPQNAPIIAGGAVQNFTWVYQANSIGMVTFTATMGNGTDLISGAQAPVVPASSAQTINIISAASINILPFTVIPPVVSIGQDMTVVMTVTNGGTGDATLVNPGAMLMSGTGSVSFISGPSSLNLTIPKNTQSDFTWIYMAASAGNISFSSSAVGFDAVRSKVINAPSTSTNSIAIQAPPSFTASMSALPSQASVGQLITIVLSVTNNGGADAEGAIGVTPVVTGTGNAVALIWPATTTIASGATTQFIWTFSAQAAGSINFLSQAKGYDINSKVTITANVSSPILIQTIPQLSSIITASPSVVGVGSAVTVIMAVSNSGQAAANITAPNGFYQAGTALTYVSGPAPSNITITSGATAMFTWIYNATLTGAASFTSIARGFDANSGNIIDSLTATSNVVSVQPNYPALTNFITALPNAVGINQKFTIIMTVSNTGIVDAPATTPSALASAGVVINLFSGPQPSNAFIAKGGTAFFTWVYTSTAAAGTVNISGTAASLAQTSTDKSDGIINRVTVDNPPNLSGNFMNILTPPSVYSVGQNMTVVMTISNTGATDAVNVSPVLPLTRVGTANATLVSGPSPANTVITAVSGTGSFTWVYKITAPGDIAYYGRANGQDARTLVSYSSVTATSNSITVQSPANLVSSIDIQGNSLNVGQQVTVIMTVVNAGQTDSIVTAPSDLFISSDSTGGMIPPIGPLPPIQTIAGLSTGFFTWTFSATGQGSVTLSGNASGMDKNSGLAVSSAMVRSNTVYVQLPSSLAINIWAVPAQPSTVKTGQQITVYMSVTNTGMAAATAITPTALVLSTPAVASLSTAPAPTASLAGGASMVFTWVYNSVAPGITDFAGGVNATDGNDPLLADNVPNHTSNNIQVVNSAYLANDLSVSQMVVSTGQLIQVVLTVTNNGTAATEAPANVTANVQIISTGSPVTPMAPAALTIGSLAAGASHSFIWTFNAVSAGTLSFSAYASYNDMDGSKNSVPQLSPLVEVQNASALIAAINVPAFVSQGQTFTVAMTVTNNGGANANAVTPVLVTGTVAGLPVATLVTPPVPAIIAGGSSNVFIWTFLANAAGTVYFSVHAAGTDQNSGLPVDTGWLAKKNVVIEVPANLSITAFTVYPPVVTQAQWITVSMTVSNFGQAIVTNVTPSISFSGGGVITLLTGPIPASADFGANSSTTFVWTYSATATGLGMIVSASAQGFELNTGAAASTGPSPYRTLDIIAKQAILTSEVIVIPPTSSFNQVITVQLSVTNTGYYAANNVQPDVLSYGPPALVGAALTSPSGSLPLSVNASRVFQWTFSTTYTAGVLSFSTRATGMDSFNLWAVASQFTQAATTISAPASLAVAIVAFPSTVSEGQYVTILMTVTNTAVSSAAVSIMPTQLFKSGTGFTTPNNPSVSSPSSVSLIAGAAQTFTWIVVATNPGGAGVVQWSGWATGSDENSGQGIIAPSSISNLITIQSPASLTPPDITIPATVSLGQDFTVIMTTTDFGQGAVNNAVPSPNPPVNLGTGGFTIVGALPSAANIPGGGAVTFTWVLHASALGTIQLQGIVKGLDVNLGLPINSPGRTSSICTVQSPAALASSIFVSPLVNYNGQLFTVSLVVTNTGQAAATNVSATPLAMGIIQVPTLWPSQVGPDPLTVTVAGGASYTFKWTFTAYGEGNITFSSNAMGTEPNTGNTVTSAVTGATTNILSSAALSSSMWISQTTLTVGQQLKVRLTVTNTGFGVAPALNVQPIPNLLFRYGTPGSVSFISGPSVIAGNPASVPVGSSVVFEWTYSANSAGISNFSVQARATDAGIGVINAVPELSMPVTVQTVPNLAATSLASPVTVDIGQTIQVSVTITNTGGTDVNNVNLTWGYTVSGGGSALTLGPNPATAVNIAGNSAAVFNWTFTATGSGTFTLTASASGTDANDNLITVTSNVTAANTVNINMPSALTSYISTIPAVTLSRGQVITVILTVSNTGDTRANNVSPAVFDSGTGTIAGPLTSPSAANLPGNSVGRFTWTYSATGIGLMTFSAYATGATDALSGLPVPVIIGTETADVNITPPMPNLQSTLSVSALTMPDAALNQFITVILNVTNAGVIAATAVTPTLDAWNNVILFGTPPAVSPVPAGSIAAYGGTASFTWVLLNKGLPGYASVTVSATGTSLGLTLTSVTTQTGGMNVQPSGPDFLAEISLTGPNASNPTVVGLGEIITLIMTVTNIGQTTADTVVPLPVTPNVTTGSTGNASVITGPVPLNAAAIAPNSAVTFTWTFSATVGGTISFTSGIQWTYPGNTRTRYFVSPVMNIEPGVSQLTAVNTMLLNKNRFNPLAGETVGITFSLKSPGSVTIIIFNVAGQKIRTMNYNGLQSNILYTQLVAWDGRGDDGMLVTSGIYYIKLKSTGTSFEVIKTVAVVKQ
jgi:hypothetical protein